MGERLLATDEAVLPGSKVEDRIHAPRMPKGCDTNRSGCTCRRIWRQLQPKR
jgi:hypothetical protein